MDSRLTPVPQGGAMSNSIQLDQVERNARRAIDQDGLTYLFLGLLLLLVGFSLRIEGMGWLGGFGIFLAIPLEALRRRITYPRIGFARFETPRRTVRGILGFAAIAVLVLGAIALAFNGRYQRVLPIVIGVVFALAFYFGASVTGLRLRNWVTIGLILVSGVVTAVVFTDWHMATAVQMWIVGTLLLIVGAADLWRFLRTHPVMTSAPDEVQHE